jgi:hypothetical protein
VEYADKRYLFRMIATVSQKEYREATSVAFARVLRSTVCFADQVGTRLLGASPPCGVTVRVAIANGNFLGTGFDLTSSVAEGDRIDFVVDSLGNNCWDSTTLDPTITFRAH